MAPRVGAEMVPTKNYLFLRTTFFLSNLYNQCSKVCRLHSCIAPFVVYLIARDLDQNCRA